MQVSYVVGFMEFVEGIIFARLGVYKESFICTAYSSIVPFFPKFIACLLLIQAAGQ